MSQDNPVPKLDLAPKLKRPLSLWNPLDYLRLLYWVFYFPQALRWYVDTFGGGYIPDTEMNWRKGLSILRENTVQRQLLFQGLVLTITVPLLLCLFLEQTGIEIVWLGLGSGVVSGIVSGVANGVASGVASVLALSVTLSLTLGISLAMVLGLASDIASDMTSVIVNSVISDMALGIASGFASDITSDATNVIVLGVALGTTLGVTFGVVLGIANSVSMNVVSEVASDVANGVSIGIAIGVSLGVILGIALGEALGIAVGVANGLALGVALGIALSIALGLGVIRPESWLINAMSNLISTPKKTWLFPHITYLPLPQLTNRLVVWLSKDWETGLENLNQVLQYSLQFIPVIVAVNRVLGKIPEKQIVFRVTQLAQNPYDWNLLSFVSISWETELKSLFINTIVDFPVLFFIPTNWKQRVKDKFEANIRLDTTYRATAAGFWYLHEEKPDLATKAFAIVRDLPYGEELFILTQALTIFQHIDRFETIASFNFNRFPTENLLRPTTWTAMNSLRRVVEDIKLIQQSASRNTKSFAYSRAIGELAEVINNQEQILAAERALIVNIAQTWKQSLEKIGKSIGNVAIAKPVRNPYVIGNPVTGSLFVGREDILRQLEELWIMGNQLQSVVLYGHRRMGKTSILVNIANNTGSEIKVVYLNLQRLGAISQGVAEVLIAISDAIAKQLNIPSPEDEAFLKLPQRTFERYLEQVIDNMSYRGLIIALDEFETIEKLIELGQLDACFMGCLRGLIQINPAKLAFAFAGLHTLEEMTADYFEPFFASVIPINVGFVSAGATKILLANPTSQDMSITQTNQENSDNLDHDFLLDYTGEALDLIHNLTSGQPYLTQLIGFQLVRNYNDQVFKLEKSRNPIFSIADVEAVITNSFFQQGRYYFEGVWGQAKQGATGQQEILAALAPHPEGISKDELISATGLDLEQLTAAIDTLKRHDVIEEQDSHYRIIVELFRRWVVTNQ